MNDIVGVRCKLGKKVRKYIFVGFKVLERELGGKFLKVFNNDC